jgi:putative flavoprotein involved in K+ transport
MYDALDGMPFPGSGSAFPTKDQMGDYLEAYASRFRLPALGGTRVDSLTRVGDRYIIEVGDRHFEARQVVVAMSNYQVPRLPAFAAQLDPAIHQIHTRDYSNPRQLSEGDVLIVGAGNSAAEIAKDLGTRHRIFMAGPSTGEIPGSFDSFFNQRILVHILFRLVFRHILSVNTPIGRMARPKIIKHGAPLIRVKSRDLAELGVQRVGRVVGAREGLPLLEDGTALRVPNIVWCTGFEPGFSWISLPILLADGKPDHERGIIANEPGLYFVGLHFLTAMSSAMIQGVGRDARRIVETISRRIRDEAGNAR